MARTIDSSTKEEEEEKKEDIWQTTISKAAAFLKKLGRRSVDENRYRGVGRVTIK